MSKRNWKLFIEDILESIELIKQYVEKMKIDNFKEDRKTIDAVVRNLEIIGEASRYVSEEIKQKYPKVDWKGVSGLRNRIAHEYFGLSVEIIWEIITKELPSLKKEIEQILKEN
jgi:uncharacterized protein with HEPN domain